MFIIRRRLAKSIVMQTMMNPMQTPIVENRIMKRSGWLTSRAIARNS
jgi:hypothetical protein